MYSPMVDGAQTSVRDSRNLLKKESFFYFLAGDGDYKPLVSAEPDVTTVEMDGSEVSPSLSLSFCQLILEKNTPNY